jgi:hypothetical protein
MTFNIKNSDSKRPFWRHMRRVRIILRCEFLHFRCFKMLKLCNFVEKLIKCEYGALILGC